MKGDRVTPAVLHALGKIYALEKRAVGEHLGPEDLVAEHRRVMPDTYHRARRLELAEPDGQGWRLTSTGRRTLLSWRAGWLNPHR